MTLIELSAAEAIGKIRNGEITSEELVQACLDRIEEHEATIGAWAHLDPDHALDQAKRADECHAKDLATGPLHGVPVGVKDIIDTADLPTENGTVLHGGRTPSEDATLVSHLRQAGAVILGKTVTTELAVYAPGKTTNPNDASRTPGGSSSGSAAAVADFMTPLAVGSQTNGSVIRPASFCGVYGYKPTHGRISRYRVLAQSHHLDTMGVFARNLEDLALIAEVLMVHDDCDPDMRPIARPKLSQRLAEAQSVEPKLAFVLDAAVFDVKTEVEFAVALRMPAQMIVDVLHCDGSRTRQMISVQVFFDLCLEPLDTPLGHEVLQPRTATVLAVAVVSLDFDDRCDDA